MLARDERIEPGDWMPEAYRTAVGRQIAQHARHFARGLRAEREWITRAPTLQHRASLFARVQARAAHVLHLTSTADTLSADRSGTAERLLTGPQGDCSILGRPARGFAEVGVIGWLVDGAALCLLAPLRRSSYGPLARATLLVCRGEFFHRRQGYELLLTTTHASARQRAVVQAAVDRWWWPALLMFGPPGAGPSGDARADAWKVARPSGEELRRSFVARTAPQAERLGVRLYDRQPP